MSIKINPGKLYYPECAGEIEFFPTREEAEKCATKVTRVNCLIISVILCVLAVVIYYSKSNAGIPLLLIGAAAIIPMVIPSIVGGLTGNRWTASDYEIKKIEKMGGVDRYQAVQQVIQNRKSNDAMAIQQSIADSQSSMATNQLIGLFGRQGAR